MISFYHVEIFWCLIFVIVPIYLLKNSLISKSYFYIQLLSIILLCLFLAKPHTNQYSETFDELSFLYDLDFNDYDIMNSDSLAYQLKIDIKNPKIGLINIGKEPGKGSELYREAYELLKQEFPSFIGNVESRDILTSEADVLICDGFVGNTLIKFAEGWVQMFSDLVKLKIKEKFSYKLGAKMLYPVLQSISSQYDYEEHGGSPLLGVNGICIVSHGSSNVKAIKNSIFLAKKCFKGRLIADIRIGLAEHMENNDQ